MEEVLPVASEIGCQFSVDETVETSPQLLTEPVVGFCHRIIEQGTPFADLLFNSRATLDVTSKDLNGAWSSRLKPGIDVLGLQERVPWLRDLG